MSEDLIQRSVYLTQDQINWLDKKAINLAKYVRNKIKEDMKYQVHLNRTRKRRK